MNVDWTINFSSLLGSVVMLLGFAGCGFTFVATVKKDLEHLSVRLAMLEKELAKISEVLISLARQEERLNSLENRFNKLADYVLSYRKTKSA